MANRIVTLKDESNNELYPQTIGSAVYCTDPSTNQSETVQAIIDSIYGGAGGSGGSGGSSGGSETVSASDVTLSVTSSVPFITIGSNNVCNMGMPTFSGNNNNSSEIAAIQSGDRLLITDNNATQDDGKPIRASSIKFGSNTTQFLANNGTWATPSVSVTQGSSNRPGAFVGAVGGTSLYVEPASSGYGSDKWPQGSVRPIANTAGLRGGNSDYAFLGKKVLPPDPSKIITYFTDFSKELAGDFIAIPVLTDVGTIDGEKSEYEDSVPYIILPAELTTGKQTLGELVGALPTSPK